jgi:UPF0716 protein FxsA
LKFWFVLVFFVAEFYVTSQVISIIGFWWVVALFIASFFIGMIMLKNAHFLITASISSLFASPNGAKKVYTSGIFFVLGAILFIVPGILSDIIGFFLILYSFYLQTSGTITNNTTKQQKDSDVIDAEIISSHTISNNSNSKHSV